MQFNGASAEHGNESVYQLVHEDGTAFDIDLDPHEQDDITVAIRSGAYRFPAMFGLLGTLAPAGGHVLDLGAHIGTFSLYAAARGFETLSVEASPRNAAILGASIQRNGFKNIRLVNAAVSDARGAVEFVSAGPYGFVAHAQNHHPTTRVRAVTVDELLRECDWERVDFVKMDIEGSEPAAVRGMEQLLSRDDAPPLLFESNGYTLNLFGRRPADIMVPLENCGYSIFLIDAGRLVPVSSTQIQSDVLWDCLALKQIPKIGGWPLAPAFTSAEIVDRLLATCIDRKAHTRLHAALALREHAEIIASDTRIPAALDTLAEDPDDAVRAGASWWSARSVTRAMNADADALTEKDIEIRRLRALVDAYERGKFMRFMRWLHVARHKISTTRR